MKYSEAKKQIEALSSKYSTDMIGEYFNVNYKGAEAAYISTKQPYFIIWTPLKHMLFIFRTSRGWIC